MRKLLFAGAAVAVLALGVQAKTVALWPLTHLKDGNPDLRCATDLRFNLSGASYQVEIPISTPGDWNLPPNPVDEGELVRPAVTRSVIVSTAEDQAVNCGIVYLTNNQFADYLYPTNSFTVEGWMRIDAFKAGTWRIVVQAGNGSGAKAGWTLSVRHDTSKGYYLNLYMQDFGTGTSTLADTPAYNFIDGTSKVTDAELLGSWHHYAAVFEHDSGKTSGKSRWLIYFDGRLALEKEWDRYTTITGARSNRFDLGGRTSVKDQRVKGAVSYWRVCDEALAPEQFLNAGGAGTVVPEEPVSPTVAYWTFANRDGGVDARDQVGTAHLSDAWNNGRIACPVAAALDSAFAGRTPPNANTTLASDNNGSFLLQYPGCYLQATNLVDGAGEPCLDFDHAFTIEGWFKPAKWTSSANIHYVFGTRIQGQAVRQWILMYKYVGSHWNFYLLAEDGTTLINGDTTLMTSNDDKLNDWGGTWKHVALTHAPAGGPHGRGLWKLYLDGVLTGACETPRDPDATKGKRRLLYVAGANGVSNRSFPCQIDCLRVSGAALEPDQFLNAQKGRAATDVIALWPLDQMDGVALDGHDEVAGGAANNLFGRTTPFYCEKNVPTHAVPSANSHALLTNPDRSVNFVGNATNCQGCVAFSHVPRCALGTSDGTIAQTLGGNGQWTLEGFVCKTGNVGTTDTFGMMFGAFADATVGVMASWSLCVQKATEKLILRYDHSGAGVEIPLMDEALDLNAWHHFAWECEHDGTAKTGKMWFYLDGVLKKTVDLTAQELLYITQPNTSGISFGGLNQNNRNFPGSLSHVRLSNKLLAPSEFLNAAAPAPTPAVQRTLAYWAFDQTEGGRDVSSLVGPSGYDIYTLDNSVTGHPDAATAQVLCHEPQTANVGSITIPSGKAAQNEAIGFSLEMSDSWTVDGWVRPAADGQKGVLFGTMNSVQTGFRLSIDLSDGAPKFHLVYRDGNLFSPYVDADFPKATGRVVSMAAGRWTHLALVHDAANRDREWTLYVNGRLYGTLANDWRGTDALEVGPFAFGDRGGSSLGTFAGEYDLWRVSAGALDRLELNYDMLTPGMLLILR